MMRRYRLMSFHRRVPTLSPPPLRPRPVLTPVPHPSPHQNRRSSPVGTLIPHRHNTSHLHYPYCRVTRLHSLNPRFHHHTSMFFSTHTPITTFSPQSQCLFL